jgi:cellulose synthase/poly-beta-1,6-N-acetylglucosamine synthase-like glycosyltransferase
MAAFVRLTAWSVAVLAGLPSLYLAVLSALAPVAARRPRTAPPAATVFAVLVPAHNEASVIAASVRSLLDQAYPPSRYTVHVVADNCDDRTSEVAAAAGATVHVRADPTNRGKGAALNWLIDELRSSDCDAFVIVDADTQVDPGFLAALDRSLGTGSSVTQGFYGVDDPGENPTVGLRFAAMAARHHLRPLARTAIGASCGLYGNGMAFRTDILRTRRWTNHLIEDAEFQLELLLDGHRVAYAPDATLRAEMPISLEGATSQNERWELGRLQLARTYLPRLCRTAVTGGPLPRRAYVDAIADLVSPPLTAQAALDLAAVMLGGLSIALRRRRGNWVPFAIGLGSGATLVVHVFVALRLVHAPPSVYRSLRAAPRAVAWKLTLLARIVRKPAEVSWTRTTRNAENAGELR